MLTRLNKRRVKRARQNKTNIHQRVGWNHSSVIDYTFTFLILSRKPLKSSTMYTLILNFTLIHIATLVLISSPTFLILLCIFHIYCTFHIYCSLCIFYFYCILTSRALVSICLNFFIPSISLSLSYDHTHV